MPITESQPFSGSIHEIRKTILDNQYYGKQAVILYFGSIGERGTPEICEWHAQPPGKIDKYEKDLIKLIGKNFQKYPVIIGAIPPHAGTLFGFGSPLLEQSEVNAYRLATVNVQNMSIKKENTESPIILGCPLDITILFYELQNWQNAKTLEEFYDTQRNHKDVFAHIVNLFAHVKNPNKASKTAQEFIAQLHKK